MKENNSSGIIENRHLWSMRKPSRAPGLNHWLYLSMKNLKALKKNCPQTWCSKSNIRAGGIFFAIYISVVIIMKYTWFWESMLAVFCPCIREWVPCGNIHIYSSTPVSISVALSIIEWKSWDHEVIFKETGFSKGD